MDKAMLNSESTAEEQEDGELQTGKTIRRIRHTHKAHRRSAHYCASVLELSHHSTQERPATINHQRIIRFVFKICSAGLGDDYYNGKIALTILLHVANYQRGYREGLPWSTPIVQLSSRLLLVGSWFAHSTR